MERSQDFIMIVLGKARLHLSLANGGVLPPFLISDISTFDSVSAS